MYRDETLVNQPAADPRASPAGKPLDGLTVLDLSQFLAGPSAALRLADLGARVIKVERPSTGESGRQLYISNLSLEGDSTLFHSINRNKESFAANLKDAEDHRRVIELVRLADVLIHNFRPGVIERLQLDYETVSAINPRLVYLSITGYGEDGPWRDRPGQDLLAQSLSGLTWLSGDAGTGPVPMGLAVADMFAGAHAVQGVLACLVRRGVTGRGGRVDISLMESILDLQFEVLTTYLNDGGKSPQRSAVHNAHAYLSAPYGIYATQDGHIALAMGSVTELGVLLGCDDLERFKDPDKWFTERDTIKTLLAKHLRRRTTGEWLSVLQPAGYWCSPVYTWDELFKNDAFSALQMVQTVSMASGATFRTLRCPIRIDGQLLVSEKGSPHVGEDNERILKELAGDS